jgi:hypothetical protein
VVAEQAGERLEISQHASASSPDSSVHIVLQYPAQGTTFSSFAVILSEDQHTVQPCTLEKPYTNMAEVAGLVIGGVGLAALFDTCMSTFEYVDTGRKYGVDYQKAALKVSVLELRLSRWGQQVRFSKAAGGEDSTSEEVERLLGEIQMNFEDAFEASKKYVMPKSKETGLQVEGSGALESLGDTFRRLSLKRQNKTSLAKKARWALRDKKKLGRLIDDIKESIESLENLSSAISAPSPRQRQEVMKDVQELIQPAEIEEPESATEPIIAVLKDITDGVDDQLREAVNVAAAQVATGDSYTNIFTSDKAKVILGDYVVNGYNGPIVTAAQRHPIIMNGMRTTGSAKVIVGHSYGGTDIMADSD